MENEDALIKLLDVALGAMNTVGRINDLITTARAEGRTVTVEEVDALVNQSTRLRREWDDAGQ